MDDGQPNGELKKIFLAKPQTVVETPAEQPTTSSPPPYRPVRGFVGTRVRIPPRRHFPPVEKPEDYLSNQKKQRYWNSWEELYLVELWRRYRDEVTILNVPLPVYRKMMIAMRNRNMLVTAQDCRRKVNTLNTRYKLELRRMESTGGKSDWRLFPLMHCIMCPKVKEFEAWHETRIIKKLLDKIPKPVEVKPPPTPIQINNLPKPQIQQISSNPNPRSIQNTVIPKTVSLPPVDTDQPPRRKRNYRRSTILQVSAVPEDTPMETSVDTSADVDQPPRRKRNYRRSAIVQVSVAPDDTTTETSVDTPVDIPTPKISPSQRRSNKRSSILPFRNITLEKLEQIRQDNNRLAIERDETLEHLHLEERAFELFETFILSWYEQKQFELRKVQQLSENCGFNMENEENHNVEQQQQETVGFQ